MKSGKNISIPTTVARRSLIVTHNLKWLSELNLFTVWLIIPASVLSSLEISRSGIMFSWDMKLHEKVI
jgi:hypothetical protein